MSSDHAISRRARVEARNFMVGLFMPSMSGGWTVSRATNLESYRYDFRRKLALMTDADRLDYVFMGRGFTPPTHNPFKFRDRIADSISLAAAFGAITTNPMVIATIHILYRHAPLFTYAGGGGAATTEARRLRRTPSRVLRLGERPKVLLRARAAIDPRGDERSRVVRGYRGSASICADGISRFFGRRRGPNSCSSCCRTLRISSRTRGSSPR